MHFWVKLLKSELYQNGRLEKDFKYVAIFKGDLKVTR